MAKPKDFKAKTAKPVDNFGASFFDLMSRFLKRPLATIFLAILTGFIVGGIVLLIAGFNPITSYWIMLKGVFSKPKYIAQTIIDATPIIVTGVSVAFAFKTGLFNIGAEGQYIVGAVTAAFIGKFLPLPPGIHPIAVILCAMVAAGLLGALIGFLKARFGIHEVISSIMFNWMAFYLNNLYITIPGVKKPGTEASYEVLQSAYTTVLQGYKTSPEGFKALSENQFLKDVLLRTDLNYGILVAIAVAVIAAFILKRTTLGYSLRAVGFNKSAAEFSGINVSKNIIISMAIAGAIAGLAGALQIVGVSPHRISTISAFEGFGLNGLSVALIANVNAIGCIFSGLLFGALKYGGTSIQSELGVPTEIINIMIGTIVFFIGMANLFNIISHNFSKIADRFRKKGGEAKS